MIGYTATAQLTLWERIGADDASEGEYGRDLSEGQHGENRAWTVGNESGVSVMRILSNEKLLCFLYEALPHDLTVQ
jgi:hypothetical protein